MLTQQDLETLRKHTGTPGSPVLSAYLHMERSQLLEPSHYLETLLKQYCRRIEARLSEDERKAFQADADQVLGFLKGHTPQGKSLVCFSDASENYLWVRELQVPLHNTVRWFEGFYLRPLLEVCDDYERYGVILTNKTQARLFSIFLGEVEEEEEAFAPAKVRHLITTGTDHLWSQMNFQRKAQVHAHWHLKQVALAMEHLAERLALDRLILAGPVEATSELYRLLPKRWQSRVVAKLNLPLEASKQQILQETLAVEQSRERAAEREMVEALLTAAAKQDRAVLGLEPTLGALNESRVATLLYAEEYRIEGGQCSRCATLFAPAPRACSYCEGLIEQTDDLVELMVERVWDEGGKVEQVHEGAAQTLRQAGSIGAFLRF